MSLLVDILSAGLRQGLLLVPLAIGVHVSFRLLRYPDLTPDGSLIIGGASCALLLMAGADPVLALVGGAVSGGLSGILTGLLSEYLGLDRILAGIAVSLFSYSITLRLLGRGNLPLPRGMNTVYEWPCDEWLISMLLGAALVFLICWIAGGRWGLKLRAVGENSELVEILGGNRKIRVCAGLFLANCCVGLSGGLLLESQRFVDVGQGAGALFIGLACVLVGMALPVHNVRLGLVFSAAGAILYASLIAGVLRLGLQPGDLRAMTAVLVLLTVLIGRRFTGRSHVPLF